MILIPEQSIDSVEKNGDIEPRLVSIICKEASVLMQINLH
jgi:hypothetical protein